MDHFWRSAQGEMIRFRRRREESVRISLPLELPTKRTRPGTKAKAKAALAEAFATDILARRAREVTLWPKPRAAVALDLHVWSGTSTGARVDSVCKWLLDELAGLVYADDRQVKMLFAQVARPQPLPKIGVPKRDGGSWGVSGELYDEFDRLARAASQSNSTRLPHFYLTAQTRANVLADLRAVTQLEERWDPFDDEHGLQRDDPFAAMFRRDELVDYHAIFDTDSDRDMPRRRLLSNQIDYHNQTQQQSAVDLVFSSLFTELPVDRFGIWGRVRGRISFTPYIFDVGVLPGPGESAAFMRRFRALLQERRERWPGLFPMRARSGISMVLFEDPKSGKDLDNLIRSVLPDILEILRPQQHDLHGWIADEADPAEGVPSIPFIEVAAFPAHLADMEPGSVVFGLSTADRFDSWWALATGYLGRVLEEQEDRGWW